MNFTIDGGGGGLGALVIFVGALVVGFFLWTFIVNANAAHKDVEGVDEDAGTFEVVPPQDDKPH